MLPFLISLPLGPPNGIATKCWKATKCRKPSWEMNCYSVKPLGSLGSLASTAYSDPVLSIMAAT